MFNRVSKLRTLLQSAEATELEKVYVADNGRMTANKEELYDSSFDFDLEVFDLEYDAGVGTCRRALSERPSEEFLLILDSDMEVPPNYRTLQRQLKRRPDIGGISGLLIENGRIYTSAADLYEENGTLHKDIRELKTVQEVGDAPFVEFDFIPQVGIFRQECLADYTWDEFYRTQREHVDFFVGHLKKTNWKFGISPEVYFRHHPGGGQDYNTHRRSQVKRGESKQYFREKWGYDEIRSHTHTWIDTYNPQWKGFGTPRNGQLIIDGLQSGGISGALTPILQVILKRLGFR